MATAVQPGTVLLGKYIVERQLGAGGMGIVVAARHMELGELFAIKLMLEAALDQAELIERFLREARASARLKSEHAVRVHDVGRLPTGAPYMVMEHLAGQDLRQILRSRGALPVDEAVRYVLEACEAVAEAHALGIVHRDLKPANLFLAKRPTGPAIVKVLDFGISKELDPEQRAGSDLTRTGSLLGSPNYMSPEQMTHAKDADPRSDIWSLGVVLFQLLTGEMPFKGTMLTEVVAQVLQAQTPRPSTLRPDLPPELEAVVMKCLQKKIDDRYQTIADFMVALESFTGYAGGRLPYRPTALSIADTLRRDGFEIPPVSAPRPSVSVPVETPQPFSMQNPATISDVPTGRGWSNTAAAASSVRRAKLGMWLFLATATLLFGGAAVAYISLREPAPQDTTQAIAATNASPPVAPVSAAPAVQVLPASSIPEPPGASAKPLASAPVTTTPTKGRLPPVRTTAQPASTRKLPGFDD